MSNLNFTKNNVISENNNQNFLDSHLNSQKDSLISEKISNNIYMLNTNINKRFHNYYFNNKENDAIEQRTNSGNKLYNITKDDKEEFKKKFDHDLYLK